MLCCAALRCAALCYIISGCGAWRVAGDMHIIQHVQYVIYGVQTCVACHVIEHITLSITTQCAI